MKCETRWREEEENVKEFKGAVMKGIFNQTEHLILLLAPSPDVNSLCLTSEIYYNKFLFMYLFFNLYC